MTAWRIIPSYPDYEASEDGRVRRCTPFPPGRRPPSGRDLEQRLQRNGYLTAKMRRDGAGKEVGVHTLVCEAFHGRKADPRLVAAHKNGNPTDNRASNIRWCTQAENIADKKEHGTLLSGEKHPQAKLTAAQVLEIRKRYVPGRGGGAFALAREYGINPEYLRIVATGRKWKDLP